MRARTFASSAGLDAPRFEPDDPVAFSPLNAVYGTGPVAERRPQKYLAASGPCEKSWPMSDEPTALPSFTMIEPFA